MHVAITCLMQPVSQLVASYPGARPITTGPGKHYVCAIKQAFAHFPDHKCLIIIRSQSLQPIISLQASNFENFPSDAAMHAPYLFPSLVATYLLKKSNQGRSPRVRSGIPRLRLFKTFRHLPIMLPDSGLCQGQQAQN